MIENLQQFVEGFDPIWQWIAIMLISGIPLVESYFGGPLGILAGVNPVIVIMAAIIGNIISMLLFVFFGEKIQANRKNREKPLSHRKQKFKDRFDRYGIAGVSLLGQTLLPSQVTSMAMVSFGAPRNKVIFWQIISIILWGIAFGILAVLGFNMIQ